MKRRGFQHGELASAVVLAGVILAVFGATVAFGLLSWDDDRHLTANLWLNAADWPRFWTGRYLGLYVPVVYTLWTGLRILTAAPDPRVFHGINVLIHAMNAVLVFRLVGAVVRPRSTSTATPLLACLPALGGALVFALHPLQVETVAWASGFRDLTSTSFALSAMLAYGAGMTGVGVAAFVAALLCKPAVAALPVALAGALWAHESGAQRVRVLKQSWRLGLWLMPAVAVAFATWLIQGPVLDGDVAHVTLPQRLIIAADALGFYLTKLVVPMDLAVDYGRSPAFLLAGRGYLATGALAVAVIALVALMRRRLGPLVAGLVFAALALSPVLGLVPFAFQHVSTVADHYAYLPFVGVALAVAAALARLPPRVDVAATVVVALALAGLSWRRLPVWRDDGTFFAAMLASNPTSISARIGLGGVATGTQDFPRALVEFDAALALEPHNVTVIANRGLALAHLRRYAEVLAFVPPQLPVTPGEIHRSPQTEESYTAMYVAVGYAYLGLGRPAEAVVALCRAGELDPRHKDVATFLPVAREQLRLAGAPAAAGVCH